MRSQAPYDVAVRRVERGYRWLLAEGPRYGLDVNRVDPKKIRMEKPDECVVAYATGNHHVNFDHIFCAVGRFRPEFWTDWFWGVRNGFMLNAGNKPASYDRQGVSYELLTQAWVDVITKHRNGQVDTTVPDFVPKTWVSTN